MEMANRRGEHGNANYQTAGEKPNSCKYGKTNSKGAQGKSHKNKQTKSALTLCNKGRSNLDTLLVHLHMEEIQTKWKPTSCTTSQEEAIPETLNNIRGKWRLIQQHNHTGRTEEEKHQTVKNYMGNSIRNAKKHQQTTTRNLARTNKAHTSTREEKRNKKPTNAGQSHHKEKVRNDTETSEDRKRRNQSQTEQYTAI